MFLEEHLASGRIRRSKSQQAAPFFITKGKEVNNLSQEEGLQLLQDYWHLNTHTVQDKYPLPLIMEILHHQNVQKVKMFTVLDIRWGYNNLRIREGDEWKAAFSTNKGLFEPLVMFFGLCNSPATFQRMIDIVFQDVIKTGHVFAYIDDILIAAETVEELWGYTKRVLDMMKK